MKEIREVQESDLKGLLELYMQLRDQPMPEDSIRLNHVWWDILESRHVHTVVGVENGVIVSSCMITIIPNLTHGQRPYAIIENVITDIEHRRRGWATKVLEYAKDQIAKPENCYKIMLLTGQKEQGVLDFYEDCGYNKNDKTAFIKWLF